MIQTSHRLITLDKIISVARKNDIIVIAGDFFDSDSADEDLLSQTAEILQKSPAPLYVLAKKHEKENFEKMELQNLKLLPDDGSPVTVQIEDTSLHIYGADENAPDAPFNLPEDRDEGIHIGVVNAEKEHPEEPDFSLFKKSGLDLFFIGGTHAFKIFRSNNRLFAISPGSPETVYDTEQGDRYCAALEISNNSFEKVKRVAVNTLKYIESELHTSNFSSTEELTSEVLSVSGPNTIFKARISGKSLGPDNFSTGELEKKFHHLVLERNEELTLEQRCNRDEDNSTIKGQFYLKIRQDVQNNNLPDIDEEELLKLLNLFELEGAAFEEGVCALFK